MTKKTHQRHRGSRQFKLNLITQVVVTITETFAESRPELLVAEEFVEVRTLNIAHFQTCQTRLRDGRRVVDVWDWEGNPRGKVLSVEVYDLHTDSPEFRARSFRRGLWENELLGAAGPLMIESGEFDAARFLAQPRAGGSHQVH